MAREIRAYTLTIPAGTTAAAPLIKPTTFPARTVDGIAVIVPPGPSGVVGFCIRVGGVRVIPYDSDQWIITAGESITWPLEHQPDSGDWSVAGYNTGTVAHTVYFRFLLSLTAPGGAPEPATIDESALSSSDFALFNYPTG